jgi:DNA repair protein RadC
METTNGNLSMVAEIRVDLYPRVKISSLPQIKSSKEAYEILVSKWSEISYRERFKILFLNSGNRVIGIKEISAGGINGTVVDIKMILQAALGVNANRMILAHNHPSSTLNFSKEDMKITEKIKKAAKLMDIEVLDHILLIQDDYLSMADKGIL